MMPYGTASASHRSGVRAPRHRRCQRDEPSRLAWMNGIATAGPTNPSMSASAVRVSAAGAVERALYHRRVAATPLAAPPIFLLGHWRSGTTHLHNVLSQDPQFGFL